MEGADRALRGLRACISNSVSTRSRTPRSRTVKARAASTASTPARTRSHPDRRRDPRRYTRTEEDVEDQADALREAGEAQRDISRSPPRRACPAPPSAPAPRSASGTGRPSARTESAPRLTSRRHKGILGRTDERLMTTQSSGRGRRRPGRRAPGQRAQLQPNRTHASAIRPHRSDACKPSGVASAASSAPSGVDPLRRPPDRAGHPPFEIRTQARRAGRVVRGNPARAAGRRVRPDSVIALDHLHRGNSGIEVGALRCPACHFSASPMISRQLSSHAECVEQN